jgi:AraC-like DNA-binding protein
MGRICYSTSDARPEQRSRHWHEVIASTYFPLNLQFRDPSRFGGELSLWNLGSVSLSRLTSEALRYERLPQHLRNEREEQYLVTVPALSEVMFNQCQTEIRCKPGSFILERGHEPYVFGHEQANDLWVLKVPGEALRGRIRAPDRFSTLQFDATGGVGALFVDMLHLIPGRFETMSREAHVSVGQQLVDLLVLALKSDERALFSAASSIREAHLSRIEQYVRQNLADPELSPERVATACGISVRYLHELFRDTNQTLGQWIREQRLIAAKESIEDPHNNQSIADIAYRWGFSDQSQFSRLFRAAFGISPSEHRHVVTTSRLTT